MQGELHNTSQRKMTKISGDETQIYDRQIRLWGIEAQNRLVYEFIRDAEAQISKFQVIGDH